MSQFAEKYVG